MIYAKKAKTYKYDESVSQFDCLAIASTNCYRKVKITNNKQQITNGG